GSIPISFCHTRTGHPDLPDPIGGTSGQGYGINDRDALINQSLATALESTSVFIILACIDYTVVGESRLVNFMDYGRFCLVSARHNQGGLGKSVSGPKCFPAKAARLEGLGKSL